MRNEDATTAFKCFVRCHHPAMLAGLPTARAALEQAITEDEFLLQFGRLTAHEANADVVVAALKAAGIGISKSGRLEILRLLIEGKMGREKGE